VARLVCFGALVLWCFWMKLVGVAVWLPLPSRLSAPLPSPPLPSSPFSGPRSGKRRWRGLLCSLLCGGNYYSLLCLRIPSSFRLLPVRAASRFSTPSLSLPLVPAEWSTLQPSPLHSTPCHQQKRKWSGERRGEGRGEGRGLRGLGTVGTVYRLPYLQ
jgi:hypothetical protein